jgi:hypothetical protein
MHAAVSCQQVPQASLVQPNANICTSGAWLQTAASLISTPVLAAALVLGMYAADFVLNMPLMPDDVRPQSHQ